MQIVNSLPVNPYDFLHPDKILFIPWVYMDPFKNVFEQTS